MLYIVDDDRCLHAKIYEITHLVNNDEWFFVLIDNILNNYHINHKKISIDKKMKFDWKRIYAMWIFLLHAVIYMYTSTVDSLFYKGTLFHN